MLDELLTAAGLTDAGSVVITRVSALNGASLVPWQPCLLLLDASHGPNRSALRRYPPTTEATLISETADGLQTRLTPVDQLDDQRTDAVAIALPAVPMHDVRNHSEGLRGVIDRLRDPVDGCPWDNAQTHTSLRPHLLEETYEALEALDSGDPEALCEELGDVLMQVVLHAKLAEQDGAFDLDDVSEGIRAKLVRRHPHVFADAHVDSAAGHRADVGAAQGPRTSHPRVRPRRCAQDAARARPRPEHPRPRRPQRPAPRTLRRRR